MFKNVHYKKTDKKKSTMEYCVNTLENFYMVLYAAI